MNVKFREIIHVSPAALANFMKFQPLFWLGKFHYEFHEMDARANAAPCRLARRREAAGLAAAACALRRCALGRYM